MIEFPGSQPKVAVIAMIKDEAPYLADWIHHHLYFNFDAFYIGVNRTSDKSLDILERIKQNFQCVNFFDVDWLDQGHPTGFNPHIQYYGYSYLTHIASMNKEGYTHYIYIDTDEFWYSRYFDKDIKDFLLSSGTTENAIHSFNWHNSSGDLTPFIPPFAQSGYQPTPQLKSMISAGVLPSVGLFRPHVPQLKDGSDHNIKHLDCSDKPVSLGEHDQILSKTPASPEFAILHRVYRSEQEYMASLARARLSEKAPIKTNRWGFEIGYSESLVINPERLTTYWASLSHFIDCCNLREILDVAQKTKLRKSDSVLNLSDSTIASYADAYVRCLLGTSKFQVLIKKLVSFNPNSGKDFALPYRKAAAYLRGRKKPVMALRLIEKAVEFDSSDEASLRIRDELQKYLKDH